MTLVDSSYRTDTVYEFCEQYDSGVMPIQGRSAPARAASLKEFNAYETKMGTRAFNIVVDLYKERMQALLKRDWDGLEQQPEGTFSVPYDLPDKVLKHLTVEYKRPKRNERTGQPMGHEWYRPSGARQELWDLFGYALAGIDILAWHMMVEERGNEYVVWKDFWDTLLTNEMCYR